jgi:hypothetical protein
MAEKHGYVFAETEGGAELARLRLVEAGWDPATRRCLEMIGVTEGWACLEIGAGAGSIAAWLGRRVVPTGSVVAADIDPRLRPRAMPTSADPPCRPSRGADPDARCAPARWGAPC